MRKILLIMAVVLPTVLCAKLTPTINGNHSVTITLVDSAYDEVTLVGSFAKDECEMEKVNGVWTYTTSALPSDMYTYRFLVDDDDDKPKLDPCNPNTVRDIDVTYNFFIIDGNPGSLYETENVAHGEIQTVWYPSCFSSEMPERRMLVYLPAEYMTNTDTQYPVLYLLHGTGGDETSWCGMGRLAQIMDNMIAQGRCKPMIVVMPNGIAEQDAAPGAGRYTTAEAKRKNITSWLGKTEAAFPKEIVPYIEKSYRVLASKKERAIAGLSMGGMHTYAIAMNNPEMFDYVGLFSPQTVSGLTNSNIKFIKGAAESINDFFSNIPVSEEFRKKLERQSDKVADVGLYSHTTEKLSEEFKNPPALYYIAIGEDDRLKTFLNRYRKMLDKNKCQYTYNETSGGHSWDNWRKYLLDFLPRLFR